MLRKRQLTVCLLSLGLFAGAVVAPMVHGEDAPGNPPPPRQPGGGGGPNGGPGNGPGGFHLLPRFVEDKLDLTDDQKKQIDELEKDTKAKLEKILTADQLKTLQETRPPRGPGGGPGGGPGAGRRGPGGQGGGPGGDPAGPGGDQGGYQGRPPRPSN
jgi:Spy/CpxP family protein refolding chaperone